MLPPCRYNSPLLFYDHRHSAWHFAITPCICYILIPCIRKKLLIGSKCEFPFKICSCFSDLRRNRIRFSLFILIHISRNNDPATFFADTVKLIQCLIRLLQQMNNIRRHNHIKPFRRKINLQYVTLLKRYIPISCTFFLCSFQHW